MMPEQSGSGVQRYLKKKKLQGGDKDFVFFLLFLFGLATCYD